MIYKINGIFKRYKFSLYDEKQLQKEIEKVFIYEKIPYIREARLSDKDIVDFLIEDIALEIKIKGNGIKIYEQCVRYAQHDKVKKIILATNRAMGFPEQINGKNCYLIKLGWSWL